MRTVRAAVVNAVRDAVRVEPLSLREPRADEVLVRLGASGVCHSDLHVITGDLPMPLPAVLGHEGAGVVEEVGAAVRRVKVGDHVVLSWVPYCGSCWYCESGHTHLCEMGYVKSLAAATDLVATLLGKSPAVDHVVKVDDDFVRVYYKLGVVGGVVITLDLTASGRWRNSPSCRRAAASRSTPTSRSTAPAWSAAA